MGRFTVFLILCMTCIGLSAASTSKSVTTVTSDGVTIHGEVYFDSQNSDSPLILLFHQAGSSGRGEYADIIPWLNDARFRAIAWDQRSGGERHGGINRTVPGLADGTPAGYCDAYADLQAALDFVINKGLADRVVVWGSSYSASLVFRLAAENPDKVEAVVAFSPGSGGPMVDCRARMWVDDMTTPALVFRPASEMTLETSVEQRAILTATGATFHVVEEGVHGSSMLVDSRAEHDMSDTRKEVIAWLNNVTKN